MLIHQAIKTELKNHGYVLSDPSEGEISSIYAETTSLKYGLAWLADIQPHNGMLILSLAWVRTSNAQRHATKFSQSDPTLITQLVSALNTARDSVRLNYWYEE